MQQSLLPRRKPSTLSDPLQQRLNEYALAASAAGVSLLALAQPAEGKILYTPTHVICSRGCEIYFSHTRRFVVSFGSGFEGMGLNVEFYSTNSASGIVGYRNNDGRAGSSFASALRAGVLVRSANLSHPLIVAVMSTYKSGTYTPHDFGPWDNGGKGVKNRYVGLKFTISGKAHFGWARFSTIFLNNRLENLVCTGYAYETIPNKPIITGKTKGPDVIVVQPATLGHLARGASTIPNWRAKAGQ